tara:strand:+ start:8168 stop:8839 length:672 start_codon:yes stop_codon:yes gene_type:complete
MSLELSGTTGVKGVAGSVAAPSVVGDDTNTGISFPAADTIKFSTGGVERFAITNSGISGDGSGLTGIGGGITEADLFQLTADVTASSATDLSNNWARPNTANDGFGKLGTGMSFSGATWTFPSTGIYHVLFNAMIYANGSDGTTQFQILATEDNSNYGLQSSAHVSVTNGTFDSVCPTALIDVTNTSNVKVKFRAATSQSNQLVGSNTAVGLTYVTFIRLGDT